MQYGYFDDLRNEYVISSPRTPRPWENRIWNDKLNAQITNHGGGIIYERDPQGRFILFNWSGHRYLYVYDRDENLLWSPSWFPVNADLDFYECRHGLKYTEICGRKSGIEIVWRSTVHPSESVEIWQISIKNISGKKKNILLVPYYQIDISFKDPYWGSMNLFKGHFSRDTNCLYVKNYSHKRDLERYALGYHSNLKIDRFELDSASFLKDYSSFASPSSVRNNIFTGSMPDKSSPAFAPVYEISLDQGANSELNCEIFSADSFGEAKEKSAEFSRHNLYENAVQAHRAENMKLLEENTISCGDPSFDRFVNIWLKHQLHYNAEWVRGWDIGFRDSMQDADSWRRHRPEYVKNRILEAAKHIYKDGHSVRKWAKIDAKLYFDGGVWFVNTVINYIKESGETSVLKIELPYLDGESGTLLDHMKRAMDFLDRQRGPGGICRMGYGDWNDALNGIDREGKGESVWTSMAFVWSLKEFIILLERISDPDFSRYARICRELENILNEKYFEGDRYIRAVTDAGVKVGSAENDEGKVYLNTQSWAMISGIADKERAQLIVETVKKNLYTPWGPILLAPPYTKYREDIGRISSDVPGTVENGANYVHASVFYAYGLILAGMSDEALKILCQILPSNPDNPPDQSLLEPFNITNCYEGPLSSHPGRAMFAWRTGTVGWFLKTVWDGMLGLVPEYDGISINARLPSQWVKNGIKASRKIRGKDISFFFGGTKEFGEGAHPIANNSQIQYEEALKRGKFHVQL